MQEDLAREILSDITVHMKYSRFLPKKQRRETWEEIVDRNKLMHINRFPEFKEEIEENYKLVYDKKVLPSMRALQFSGKPIEINNSRQYNCAYMPVEHVDAFSETMFLLLGGTGVGYSVQKHHIEKLPVVKGIIKPKGRERKKRYLVGDSIEGWSDAVKVLVESWFYGKREIEFDYRDIRQKGALLITSGGKAPGPAPLRECLVQITNIFENAFVERGYATQLKPIEVHDILCHIADAVLAGGIRRAAMISLFSMNDGEMASCKIGNWDEKNPQRGRANNSAVIVRNKVKKKDFMELWQKVEASNNGEPGIYFTNDKDWGANPSLRKGTKVWTTEGIFPIEELQDKEFKVRNLDGNLSKARCWLSGRNKKLYKLTLTGGHEYFATAEHEWPIWNGEKYVKVKTPDIKKNDSLKVIKTDKLTKGNLGTREDGFFVGWLLGDGWITTRTDNGKIQTGLIVSEKDEKSNIKGILEKYIKENTTSQASFYERKGCYELNTQNMSFVELMDKFQYSHKSEGLPKTVWNEADEHFRKGLIDGLFSSDGYVGKQNVKKEVCFTTAYEKMAKDVSELLGFYGIQNSIKKTETKEFIRFDVRIRDGASIRLFRDLFSLSVKHKQERLDKYVFSYNMENDKIKVISVEKTDLKEDVWDITVQDKTHAFQLGYCVTGNCVEIALRPYGFCNLTEINASNITSQEDFNERSKVASFIGTLQASYTDFHYLREEWRKTTEKDALLGVSMTGIASGIVFNLDMEEAAKIAVEENERMAEKLNINKAARITTVKPSGTTSLVLGTSSGIHAWHNDYYIRRIRVGKNEAIYTYLCIHHPELIEDEYFKPDSTAIISVPQKAPKGAIFRNEGPIDTLERVKQVSQEWIASGHINGMNSHNVSCTISLKEDEWDEVGKWMWDNKEFYNGIAVFPFEAGCGSHVQSPFEDCSEYTYKKMFKSLHEIDLAKVIEIQDETNLTGEIACAGNSCEITESLAASVIAAAAVAI